MITRHKVYGLIFLATSFLVLSPTCSFAGSNDITTHTNCHPTISGLVTHCADASPITGVTVTYSTGSVITDNNGTYEITDASEGWYVMKFEKPCYTTRSVLGVWRCGKSYERNLCLECDPAGITGQVVDNATQQGVPGMTINLYKMACDYVLNDTKQSDPLGYYCFSDLAAGTYRVDPSDNCTEPPVHTDFAIPQAYCTTFDFIKGQCE